MFVELNLVGKGKLNKKHGEKLLKLQVISNKPQPWMTQGHRYVHSIKCMPISIRVMKASPWPSRHHPCYRFWRKIRTKKGASNSAHKRTKNNNQKLKIEETNTNANPNATNKYFRLRLNSILCDEHISNYEHF